MPLPALPGWLIDLRTAKSIFESGSNARIAHCLDLCRDAKMHVCHCEEEDFKNEDILRGPFLKDHCCIFEPDDDVMKRCLGITQTVGGKKLLVGNETAVFLTAIALSKGFGVISDHRSDSFATVYDLCQSYGVIVLSADEYFALL